MDYSEILYSKFSEPAAIHLLNNDNVETVEVNERYIREMWMNISLSDFPKSDIVKSLDENNYGLFFDAIRKCAESGENQEAETWRNITSDCCGDGRICIKSRFVFVEKNDKGSVIYESVVNITNEKVASNALVDIEYRYKQASEQINIYNWEYDIPTHDMRPCYRCMRDLGVSALIKNYPEPVIDMGIIPADYADMYREMMHKVDEGIPEIEADIPLTVGRVPFRVKYTTEFDKNGKPVKSFASATMISEKELGTIKLDNQIIMSLADQVSDLFLADFVDDSVKVIKKDEFTRIDDMTSAQSLIGIVVSDIPDADEKLKSYASNIALFRSDMFAEDSYREYVYKNEETGKWLRVTFREMERVADKTDRLLITVAVVDNLRAQKLDDERMIAQQKKELEERQKLLLEAIDEANRANNAKTVFFSNMSHDIRTPISAINGFSRLAQEEIDDRERLTDYLGRIIAAGDHLLNLINDILDMSRIESGKMELSETPVRLRDQLVECADMVRIKMDENKIDFVVNVDEVGDDNVLCDGLHFNQVILNLLSNAYKFTPEGGKVFLEGKLLEKSEKITYKIRVRDTGIGMSEEFCNRIWDAYSREKTDYVQKTQGTGLGMMIVRNIVNMMQGTIELKSKLNEGSEFIITLPLKISDTAASVAQNKNSDEALNRDYSGVTVLVVDDTQVNLKLAERILEKYGFTVRTSDSGVGAVEMIEKSKPGDIDVVLMDVMMPIMNGLDATRKIRSLDDPLLANIPIIAMTANAFASDVEQALDSGMNAHISKPFRKEDLIRTINDHLKK